MSSSSKCALALAIFIGPAATAAIPDGLEPYVHPRAALDIIAIGEMRERRRDGLGMGQAFSSCLQR